MGAAAVGLKGVVPCRFHMLAASLATCEPDHQLEGDSLRRCVQGGMDG
jgi:hypothetical protein